MSAGFSGKNGTVLIGATPVSEIRSWKFNPKSNNPRYASNKTSGYKATVAGVKEGSGSMSGAWDHTNDFITVTDVGISVTLLLYSDASHFYSVPSVIDDYSIDVDVDNGEIVSWDSNFSTNGAWANPASPLTAPAGYASTPAPTPEVKDPAVSDSMFSAAQMAMIAQTAAAAATAAMQQMFAAITANNPAFASLAVPTAPPVAPSGNN